MDRFRKFLIFLVDFVSFFGALYLCLMLRNYANLFNSHLLLFAVLFAGWLILAYIFDLLTPRKLVHNSSLFNLMTTACITHLLCAFAFLYLFQSFFALTPKTNLIIFEVLFFLFAYLLRTVLGTVFQRYMRVPVIFLDKDVPEKVVEDIKKGMYTGYKILSAPPVTDFKSIREIVGEKKGETVIVVQDSITGEKTVEMIYQLKLDGYTIISLSDFYESILLKEPLEILDEKWFVENLKTLKVYDFSKRVFDIILSIILIIIFSPIALLVAVAVKLQDGGSILYAHTRAGKNNKEFVLYKFRSMVPVHNNFVWTIKDDNRITPVGKFIRRSHLDEIPQLINILKGDISFVGPRPEQSKIIEAIRERVPYFDVRTYVKPGLTGWAQLHYLASASIDENAEKLKYDLYYIKRRSFILDILIIIKTVKLFFMTFESENDSFDTK